MTVNKNKQKYVPGTYAKQRPSVAQLVDQYIRDWERRRLKMKVTQFEPVQIEPTICFSRKLVQGLWRLQIYCPRNLIFR